MYSNGRKIITTLPKGNKEQLQIFYGLKVISMMWIIAGHGFAMYDHRSFAVNRQDIAEVICYNLVSSYIICDFF